MNPFVNPALLWWLIPLGLAPVIIHLLNRRRYRQVSWAAMDFVLAAHKRTNRRLRLENLILLLLRTAIMLLLVFSLARPLFSGSAAGSLIAQETTKNVIVALDESYSMQYRDQFSTPFERAKSFSDRLLGRLKVDRGDTISVVRFADKSVTSPEKSLLLDEARRALGDLTPSFGGTRLTTALSEVIRLLDIVKTNPEVYIVSDMRRKDWLSKEKTIDGESTGALGPLLKQISDIAGGIHIVDIGSEGNDNVSVIDLVTKESTVIRGEETTFLAEITNRSDRGTSFEATFVVDGAPTLNHPAQSLLGGETAVIEFRHTFRRAGPTCLSVRLSPDALSVDDERFLALNVLNSVRVLLVDGDPSGDSPLEREAGFLAAALSPELSDGSDSGEGTVPTLFEVHESIDTTFASRIDEGLQQYDLIVMANVDLTRVPSDRITRLIEYVESGGGLLIFLGDHIDPTLYDNYFYRQAGGGLLPCRIGNAEISPSPQRGSRLWVDFEHPMFEVFSPQEARPLIQEVPVRRYFGVQMAQDAVYARIPARYDGPTGPPAIVENRVGFGRVLLVTTSADSDWTDWPIIPSYLPTIQEAAKLLTASDPRRKNPQIGQPIQRDLDSFIPNIEVFPPSPQGAAMRSGESVAIRAISGREGWFRASYADTKAPGIYRMTADTPFDRMASPDANGEDLFAVNVAANEGDLDRIQLSELRQAYSEVLFDFSQEGQTGGKKKQQEGEIWKTLIMLLLFFLISESLLARFFGDYKR